jgi:hypothetical protein
LALRAVDVSGLCREAGGLTVTRITQHSLKNHEGRGVEIVGEARPARWRLKESAD